MRNLILLVILCIIALAGNVFALPVTDGLVIHLDAGSIAGFADGALIDIWPDISGRDNNATQPMAGNQPIYVASSPNFNGNSVVRFDGTDDWMALPSTSVTVGSFTVFAVAKFNYTENNQYIMNGQDGSGNDRIRFEWDNTQAEPVFEYRAGSSGWLAVTAPGDTGLHVFAITSTVEGFLDGVSLGTTANTSNENPTAFNIGSYNRGEKDFFNGELAEFVVYNRVLSSDEITQVNNFLAIKTTQYVAKNTAYNPTPAHEATDIQRDTILSWTPGDHADKHNVYFGTVPDDVNNADMNSPLLISPAQDVNTCDPGRLEFGQTYFWRVDEINAPPDSTVFTGDLWSFTTESFAIPIPGENITATASSQSPNQGPEKTIDESGLNADDLHSNQTSAMWLSTESEPGSAWIQYQFEIPYRLQEMLVWNYNGETILSMSGFKDVSVEYSADGDNWIQLEGVPQFPRATGEDGYASGIAVEFDGVAVKYVRITANSNWSNGLINKYGLSEVRFLVIPLSARKPSPEPGATNVSINATLSWRAGREAAMHKVYLSTDEQAVKDGTAPVVTVSQNSYGPLSLDLGSHYYWRVDEVNDAESISQWEGLTWSFVTQEYLIVDDFESYNDIPEGEEGSHLVYLTWTDGYDNPSINGSTIGYPTGASMETTIVHGGAQSVPVTYDNSTASSSEISVDPAKLAVGRNWDNGARSLILWVYGDPNNSTTEQMYVKINNAKQLVNTVDLTATSWQNVSVDLAALGVDLSNVTSLTIGFERTGATGGSGIVFIDDFQLYKPQE
jgi:hypothetical protein